MTGNLSVLLTGATGLVGRFILVELLRRHIPTIVLARSQPMRPAHGRIEEALVHFEQHTQLPRPIVLEGDLTSPGLGLSSDAWQVLQAQPLRILHSAASIRFEADSPAGEPYRTNVQGTRHLLDVAAQLQVTQFHHVSTAYVQCDRRTHLPRAQRTAYEVAVTGEQQAGNDYERSKIRSEQLVQACPHIGPVSIYRPSIVVGDSRSGYTSTYHGFYAPLQIAAGMVRMLGLDRSVAPLLSSQLGLTAQDSKNLVPVDWLAAAIVHLMENPAALGGIYHLTHPTPVPLVDMQEAILEALSQWLARSSDNVSRTIHTAKGPATAPVRPPELTENFSQQMQVYRSYFQDDPPFDCGQAQSYLSELPCPMLDRAQLTRLALAALNHNFGWPKPLIPPTPTGQLCLGSCQESWTRPSAALRDTSFSLELLGPPQALGPNCSTLGFSLQSGQWHLNSMLSSSVHSLGLRLVTTEKSLRQALSEPHQVVTLFEQGRWILRGPWPADWLDIVRDWLAHVRLVDDENHDRVII